MKNEIEAQFLDIDKDDIRSKLKEIGANLEKPEVLMRRVVFYTGEHSFARVRDEGDKIVMTYKNVSDDHSILGTKEVILGFEKKQAKFGSVDTTYQHYYGVEPDIVNLHTPEILFDMKPPKWAS